MQPRVLEADSAVVERVMRRSVAVPAMPNQAAVAGMARRELGPWSGVRPGRTAYVVCGLGMASATGPSTDEPAWTAVSSGQALRQAHRALQCGVIDLAVVVAMREPVGFYVTILALRRAAEAIAEGDEVLGLVGATALRRGRRGAPVRCLADLLTELDRPAAADGAAPARRGRGGAGPGHRPGRGDSGLYLHLLPSGRPAPDPAAARLLLWSGRDEADERHVRHELRTLLDTIAPGEFAGLPAVTPVPPVAGADIEPDVRRVGVARPGVIQPGVIQPGVVRPGVVRPGGVRAAAVATAVDAVTAVDAADAVRPRRRPVVLLFPGHGPRYARLAAGLYRRERVFTAAVDAALHLLGDDGELARADWLSAVPLPRDDRWARPMQFVVDYALGRLVLSWGVRPVALLGQDVGELAAATLAGVFSLPDAARLVHEQARRPLAIDAELRRITGELPVAAGEWYRPMHLDAPPRPLRSIPDQRGPSRPGQYRESSFAFGLHRILADFELRPPTRTVYSAYAGGVVDAVDATDPTYWTRQQSATAAVGPTLDGLLATSGAALLVEAGSGRALSAWAGRRGARRPGSDTIPMLPARSGEPGTDLRAVLTAAARMWTEGHDLDQDALAGLWMPDQGGPAVWPRMSGEPL